MSKENLSSKPRKSPFVNGEITAVECDPPSSRKSLGLHEPSCISLSLKLLKTSESSSETFGENPGDEQTAQAKSKRERENGQAKPKCIGEQETDIDSSLQFPSHSQANTKREIENGQAKTKCTGEGETDIVSNLEFPSHSQDELRKIYGHRTQRYDKLAFDSEELESSEEEEGISDGELKQTKGWKLLMKALDSKFVKKH